MAKPTKKVETPVKPVKQAPKKEVLGDKSLRKLAMSYGFTRAERQKEISDIMKKRKTND
jgi:uncharacterized protein YidB (DUF937 family)